MLVSELLNQMFVKPKLCRHFIKDCAVFTQKQLGNYACGLYLAGRDFTAAAEETFALFPYNHNSEARH